MATTTDPTRPRAFEPQTKASASPPPTPGWDLATERRIDDGKTLARAIAWFSIGLGMVELVAPERLCRYLGMEDKTELVRLYGVREIGKGIGILSQERPEGWLWARIAGDFLDLATLATALDSHNRHRDRVVGAMAAVAGITLLDVVCARQLSASRR